MSAKDVEKGKPGVYAAARQLPGLSPSLEQVLPAYLELGGRPSKKGSDSSNSSAPLFSMYLEIAKTEDNTMAERWSKNADGILIFVSALITLFALACTNRKSIGRFILCSRRFIPHVVNPEPDT